MRGLASRRKRVIEPSARHHYSQSITMGAALQVVLHVVGLLLIVLDLAIWILTLGQRELSQCGTLDGRENEQLRLGSGDNCMRRIGHWRITRRKRRSPREAFLAEP